MNVTVDGSVAARSQHLRLDRTVALRPLLQRDFELVYAWATDPAVATLWRFRGATPSPEVFHRNLWEGVLAQYIVQAKGDRLQPCGLVGLYNANIGSGYAYVQALASAQARGTGHVVRGLMLLADLAFRTWPLRKLYFETTNRSLTQFSSAAGRVLVEEARLVDHERVGADEFDDLITFSIDRQRFLDFLARMSRHLG